MIPSMPAKPTIAQLGIDPAALAWRSAGSGGAGAIEIAFTTAEGHDWVLLRVTSDPGQRVSVFTRHEWDCFLDGAKNGEFDFTSAVGSLTAPPLTRAVRQRTASWRERAKRTLRD